MAIPKIKNKEIHTKISLYHSSVSKKLFNLLISIFGLLASLPFWLFIAVLIKINDQGPVFFSQKRTGRNGKQFVLIKFRTMVPDAEKLKERFKHLNISAWPTFKIPRDPRYTSFGKYLAKTGLDELPQLINVIKGEMSLVGPRPLHVAEADKLKKDEKVRELVLPGITSSWVIKGAHRLKFSKWMELDRDYVQNATLATDLSILYQTGVLILGLVLKKVTSVFNIS